MVCWEVLDAGCDEETRQAADIGSLTSLYEVVKLSYLKSQDKLSTLPQLTGSSAWGRVAVVVGPSLFVFGDGCSDLLMQLEVDAPIDIVVWLSQGDFFILGDQGGGIYFGHVPSGRILITKNLPMDMNDGKFFIGGNSNLNADGIANITLITSLAHVVRIDNINVEGLNEDLAAANMENLKQHQNDIQLTVSNINVTTKVIWRIFLEEWQPWFGGGGGGGGGGSPLTTELGHVGPCRKIIPMYNGRYVLVLTNEGKLSVLCGMTGLILREEITGDKNENNMEECKYEVLDVTLIAGDQELGNHMLLLLLKDIEDNTHKFKIISIPGFESIYELPVPSSTHQLNLGEGAESIVFLESEVDMNDDTCSIKVKSIVDGVPEARLAKLLRKHKFIEGEEFCARFNLPVEDVHKARARFLAHMVNPWNAISNNTTAMDACGDSGPVEELLLTLDNITDSQFVTSLCIEAPLPDISTTKRILNYAKERLANTTQSSEGDQLSDLMQRVSESVYRLRTFVTIFPISDIQHWLAFSNTEMLEEFIEHLTRGNLEVASTVWHRHQYEFRSKVDQSTIEEILDAVPHTMPSDTLCSWLRKGVLADLVMLCPAAMEVIAHWAHARVTSLEISESATWPDNGLKLANTVIEILDNVAQNFQAGK
ncbi:unnamed protein product, partial [Meganyctiphanes norvegica]